jgi:hypothetical protein
MSVTGIAFLLWVKDILRLTFLHSRDFSILEETLNCCHYDTATGGNDEAHVTVESDSSTLSGEACIPFVGLWELVSHPSLTLSASISAIFLGMYVMRCTAILSANCTRAAGSMGASIPPDRSRRTRRPRWPEESALVLHAYGAISGRAEASGRPWTTRKERWSAHRGECSLRTAFDHLMRPRLDEAPAWRLVRLIMEKRWS